MQMEHVLLKGHFLIPLCEEYENQWAWVKNDWVFRNSKEELQFLSVAIKLLQKFLGGKTKANKQKIQKQNKKWEP